MSVSIPGNDDPSGRKHFSETPSFYPSSSDVRTDMGNTSLSIEHADVYKKISKIMHYTAVFNVQVEIIYTNKSYSNCVTLIINLHF